MRKGFPLSAIFKKRTIFFTLLIYLVYVTFQEGKYLRVVRVSMGKNAKNLSNPIKKILLWNEPWGGKGGDWGFVMNSKEAFSTCHVGNCMLSQQREEYSNADAVVFQMSAPLHDKPRVKLQNQVWVFYSLEPPTHKNNDHMRDWKNLFNLTMTYRTDADIHLPYAQPFVRRKTKTEIDYRSIIKEKSGGVSWIVSHCYTKSKREEYVAELLRYIDVDIFGKCAPLYGQNNNCSHDNERLCRQLIDKKYKFYLSFENSLTKDYVTEKYYKILLLNTVPVVMGQANYSLIGPPGSYIHVNDFKSAKQLAKHLSYLSKNDNEYIKHLKWKETFKPTHIKILLPKAFCDLCAILNKQDSRKKVYKDIKKWYELRS